MKGKNIIVTTAMVCGLLLLGGCASTITDAPTASAPNRVTHTISARGSDQSRDCGSLSQFVIDINNLDAIQRQALLKELIAGSPGKYSCDKLKSDLLLSQSGQTSEQDSQSIAALDSHTRSKKLSNNDLLFIRTLISQIEHRHRLHLLLEKLGQQLITERSVSEAISSDLLELQEKITRLQKLESDIYETEQSISTPATTSLSTDATQNTGS